MYNIIKNYEAKNKKNIDEKNKTLEQAQLLLNSTASAWKRNGGVVISQNEEMLIVAEADGSETITFSLQEIND